MMKYNRFFLFFALVLCVGRALAQDSSVSVGSKIVTLKEVVVHSQLNVAGFIERVKNDTTFYKAFKNLKVLGYTSLNDIRMMDKKGAEIATLQSKTRQTVKDGCRSMETLNEQADGDMYDENHHFNYYTAELYASLFFSNGSICGDNNIVKGDELSLNGKSGLAKHKEQLKMLFFNPGKKIPGIPFIGNKIALFDDEVAKRYDFIIDMTEYEGQLCYVFTIRARSDLSRGERNDIVINEMVTWFNSNTMEIVARNYDLSYDARVYDFNVRMEVQMDKVGEYLVPKVLRYNGEWHALFKKRERGVFTATIFDVRD